MRYQRIQLPFGLPFVNSHYAFPHLTRREVDAYRDWFMDQIPIRIEALTEAVRSTAGLSDWEPDYTPASLNRLGDWFAQHVFVRMTTGEEQRRRAEQLPEIIVVEHHWTLSDDTFSLCYDVGMYLAKVIEGYLEGYFWRVVLKPKNHVDLNQPILCAPSGSSLNPIRRVQVLAYSIADSSKDGSRLRELFDMSARAAVQSPISD